MSSQTETCVVIYQALSGPEIKDDSQAYNTVCVKDSWALHELNHLGTTKHFLDCSMSFLRPFIIAAFRKNNDMALRKRLLLMCPPVYDDKTVTKINLKAFDDVEITDSDLESIYCLRLLFLPNDLETFDSFHCLLHEWSQLPGFLKDLEPFMPKNAGDLQDTPYLYFSQTDIATALHFQFIEALKNKQTPIDEDQCILLQQIKCK